MTATSACMPALCMPQIYKKDLRMSRSCAMLPMMTPLCLAVQVRNLNYLNRDLDKVLLITANPDAHALQPDNAVKVCLSHALLFMLSHQDMLCCPSCKPSCNSCELCSPPYERQASAQLYGLLTLLASLSGPRASRSRCTDTACTPLPLVC